MNSYKLPLSLEMKLSILEEGFDCKLAPGKVQEQLQVRDSYFDYYRKTIENCKLPTTIKTHSQILELLKILKRPGVTKTSMEIALRKQLGKNDEDYDDMVQDLINLAVRLLLMIPIGLFLSPTRCITVSGETNLSWDEGSITELISTGLSVQKIMTERVKLEKIFNARNIERFAGIEIRWTNNLTDHLRMRDDDTAVEIFHYASFLRLHQHCHIPLLDWQVKTLQNKTRPVFPPTLITETLRTLAILFPEHDKEVESWFEQKKTKIYKRRQIVIDRQARECGQLKVEERQIARFHYWHDRLVILKQAFDEAEPRDVRQWWNDRRKRVQWYTFWVAAMVLVMTLFFGIIQCVEGALQVYYAGRFKQ